jgi:hypothetical protein
MAAAIAAVEGGEKSRTEMSRAMAEFQAACITGNWDKTECARAKAHDNLDAFFDHLASLYRSRE